MEKDKKISELGKLETVTGDEVALVEKGKKNYGLPMSLLAKASDLEEVNKSIAGIRSDISDLQIQDNYGVASWSEDDLAPECTGFFGSWEFLNKWNVYLLDTTDNAGEATTPVGKLMRNNLFRFEDGSEEQITVAYPVRVEKPYTVDKAVSAAIMDAYGLLSAGELTAFLEDIARKHRQNSNDPDVMEFDYFIEWVRCSLDGTYATKLDEVKAEVLAKIDAYDTSSSVNSFNLNGLPVWLDKDTRVGLMNSTQIEKAAGHETTTLWLGSVSLVINCDLAI